jgi:glucose-1-phosphate thymidylyltransferase
MRGLILSGGKGTRLLPATRILNKHMIPILNRPMILYPLDTLKSLGITDIMIVSGGGHIGGIAEFLGDGSDFGVTLTYRVQKEAGGIGQALGLAENFVGNDRVTVILGDNIFDNENLKPAKTIDGYARIYLADGVKDMQRFGVFRTFFPKDSGIPVLDIIEKPEIIYPNDAVVTGLYEYPPDVFEVVKTLKPSARGEIEISDVNRFYLDAGRLQRHNIKDGSFWSDAGTPESLKATIDWAYENMSMNNNG